MPLRRLARRVGRRGFSLLFLGLLDVLFAQSLWFQPAEVRATPGYRFIGSVLPLQVWGAVWLAVGLVCLAQAFMRSDRVAFAAATLLKLSWGSLYGIGWLGFGVDRGWVAATIWIAFGAWVVAVSTWPEATEIVHRANGEAVIGADSAGRITSWNATAAQLFGWRTSEILGRSLTVLIPEELRDRHEVGFARAVREHGSEMAGRVLEFPALRRDGTHVPVELTVAVWENPAGEVSFTGLVRDCSSPDVEGAA